MRLSASFQTGSSPGVPESDVSAFAVTIPRARKRGLRPRPSRAGRFAWSSMLFPLTAFHSLAQGRRVAGQPSFEALETGCRGDPHG
jgi:hypothetical protein